ncbi:DUF1643 domain-containing protein [Paracoccus sp. Z330]|uniref:DUF1643 domain-containing protein n=1 Tax=Paracoccus onchidii TaxID=3017813 RepID=A0ABT4ZHJ3_9RHOB|nr:DUF1643 domain-containing protein [Paracoccus onchidii]MDB6178788.1 DUF1643 domain-containing protein [Paracoccus onchidii]
MITRSHQDGECRSWAVFSDCLAYRYALTREWGPGQRIAYVMLNPSTADERRNDPTIERCERRARQLGFGAMQIVNLFAFRATDPRDLKRAAHPVGAMNDRILTEAVGWADRVLCAWGVHGVHHARDQEVLGLLREHSSKLCHLGLTRAGQPRHPLYISYATALVPWD